MFAFGKYLISVKKVTFGNADKVMFWISALMPEISERNIRLKQKNRRMFVRATNEIVGLLTDYPKKVRGIKRCMYFLEHIISETSMIEILTKLNAQRENEGKETIRKRDYMQRYMSDVRRAVMPYTDLTSVELESIGLLELEEYVAELQKRAIRNQQTFMNNLLQVVGCVMSRKGSKEFEKNMRDMNKMYRQLDNIGFDEMNYMPDKMGAEYGKQV